MQVKRVAFLGIEGTYSYQAAKTLFPDAELLGRRNFTEVVATVNAGEADAAVIPVENSITGRIPDVHRMMLTMQLQITAEYMLRVEHCFIRPRARPTGDLSGWKVKKLYSHSQGLMQCRGYIERHLADAEQLEMGDTANAVKHVAQTDEEGVGAIGSPAAAEFYNAVIVDRDIADEKENYTRFLVLMRPEDVEPASDADMTTLIFQVNHYPGALLSALEVFREEEINITKLETYTISQQTVLPTFYVDLGAGISSPQMRRALDKLKHKTSYMKLLGSYASSSMRQMTSGFLPAREEGR